MKVGRILRIARKICDISETEVAKRIGISRSYLCMIEKDERSIQIDLLEKYATILDTTALKIVALAEEELTEPDLRREVAKRLW
ncbi:MAG TPA: transcriptional regulator [Clostridiales bacterium]|nr:transcriptional regulator [Clostridiales bacterium]